MVNEKGNTMRVATCDDCGIGLKFGETYYAHDGSGCFCWICKLGREGILRE